MCGLNTKRVVSVNSTSHFISALTARKEALRHMGDEKIDERVACSSILRLLEKSSCRLSRLLGYENQVVVGYEGRNKQTNVRDITQGMHLEGPAPGRLKEQGMVCWRRSDQIFQPRIALIKF